MRIKEAANDLQSMSQDGDAILRSLQNNTMSTIDLMVRESLQNSLDATIDGAEVTKVKYHVNHFQTDELAVHFEGIEQVLEKKYPGTQKYIAVSDMNTVGLTGDYKTDDAVELEKSNFQKLVFGIGKNQEKEGAGGSWGLGKTSYFRLGKGIVIYYTRIKTSEGYEERLIASLIESPKQEDRLLPNNLRGIAWWGEYKENLNMLLPITNPDEISVILRVFGLKNYQNDETGSTIIIPFVDELSPELDSQKDYIWKTDYNEAIKMSVQRWYGPRLMNQTYSEVTGNSFLMCYVEEELISTATNIEPVFKTMQKLYNSALTGQAVDSSITVLPVDRINKVLDKSGALGYVAFSEVSYEELKMTPPENKPSALIHLGLNDVIETNLEDVNKVIAYSRKPGMVIEYSRTNEWMPANISLKEDHYLFAFFVPKSSEPLTGKYVERGYKNLEAYLRATENADHAMWSDEDNITIISRMKSNTSTLIQKAYMGEEKNESSSATSGLSRKFGALLMPPRGYGKKGTSPSNRRAGEKKETGPKPTLEIQRTNIIDRNHIELIVNINLAPNTSNKVFIYIMGQDQKIDLASWNKTFGEQVKYPVNFTSVEVLEGREYTDIHIWNGVKSELRFDAKYHKKKDITVKFIIKMKSHQYQPLLGIRTETKTDEGEAN